MEKTSPQILFSAARRKSVEARARAIAKHDAGFISELAANTISERLAVINREFDLALDLFSHTEHMHKELMNAANVRSVVGFNAHQIGKDPGVQLLNAIDWNEKSALPFEPGSKNLVTSLFGLHWMNDLPGMFFQIRNILAPDGLFMAAMPGDQTLRELRECLLTAESELTGNVSLRVEPFGEVRQYGNLLQRAGFTLPVVDSEQYTIRYGSLKSLVDDLRSMGATSSLANHPAYASRELFRHAEKLYMEKYSDSDGRIRATAEIVYLTGWTAHSSQQKPLKPGSAKAALSDFL